MFSTSISNATLGCTRLSIRRTLLVVVIGMVSGLMTVTNAATDQKAVVKDTAVPKQEATAKVNLSKDGLVNNSPASHNIIANNIAVDSQLSSEPATGEAQSVAENLWHTLLPRRIFDGYWAATEKIGGMGVVVEYEPDGNVTLHEYDCNRPYRPNVSVQADYDIRMKLIPTDDDNVLNVYSYNAQRISSQIQNIKIIGNMLDVEQVVLSSRPKLTMPFTYKQSDTLTPICNHDKRKKP